MVGKGVFENSAFKAFYRFKDFFSLLFLDPRESEIRPNRSSPPSGPLSPRTRGGGLRSGGGSTPSRSSEPSTAPPRAFLWAEEPSPSGLRIRGPGFPRSGGTDGLAAGGLKSREWKAFVRPRGGVVRPSSKLAASLEFSMLTPSPDIPHFCHPKSPKKISSSFGSNQHFPNIMASKIQKGHIIIYREYISGMGDGSYCGLHGSDRRAHTAAFFSLRPWHLTHGSGRPRPQHRRAA